MSRPNSNSHHAFNVFKTNWTKNFFSKRHSVPNSNYPEALINNVIYEGSYVPGGRREGYRRTTVSCSESDDTIPATGRKCKVLFSYKPAIEDELELQVGDIIDIIAEVEEGWWKGKLKDKIGVFPSNFVEETTNRAETREASQRKFKSPDESTKVSAGGVQEQASSNSHTVVTTSTVVSDSSLPSDVPVLPPKPVKELCKVIYNYEAANPDELSLHEGDIITLLTRDGHDPGWWKGEYKGKVGLFPDNFVQVLSSSEEVSPISKPERPSKALPSSKSKDSINKAMTSSMSNIASISRKYSDNVRQDEKVNHPLLSKKPVLPPTPLKKPQRSSSDLAKSPTAPNLLTKHVDSSSISSYSVKPGGSTTTTTIRSSSSNSENITVNAAAVTSSKRTIIEKSGDSLDGALWSKSGSYTVTSESSHSSSAISASNTIITSVVEKAKSDLDLVSRSAMLTHPTASRVKAPKRRPPSTVYNSGETNNGEEDSEAPLLSLTTSASSTTVTTMLNGDADAHSDKPSSNKVPWVEELKLNQAKKSMQAGNKTRVMIGGTESTSSTVQSVTTSVSSTNIATSGSTSPEIPKTVAPNITGVTLRSHQASSTSSSTVTPRPQSMVSSLRSALVSPQSNDSTITVPVKQWNDLLEKVTRLEMQFESQVGSLTKTIKELTSKLDDEKLRRAVMQQEIEKLTDLVTQV